MEPKPQESRDLLWGFKIAIGEIIFSVVLSPLLFVSTYPFFSEEIATRSFVETVYVSVWFYFLCCVLGLLLYFMDGLGTWQEFVDGVIGFVNFMAMLTFVSVILFSLFSVNYSTEAGDSFISTKCQIANQGDRFTADDQEITIGIVYYSETHRVGAKGQQSHSSWSEPTLFLNGAPVMEYKGWQIIRNSHQDPFLCSPGALDQIR
jgi:hypothetical protein